MTTLVDFGEVTPDMGDIQNHHGDVMKWKPYPRYWPL